MPAKKSVMAVGPGSGERTFSLTHNDRNQLLQRRGADRFGPTASVHGKKKISTRARSSFLRPPDSCDDMTGPAAAAGSDSESTILTVTTASIGRRA